MAEVSVLDRLRRIEFGHGVQQLAPKPKARPASAKDGSEKKAYVAQLGIEVKRFHAGNKDLRTKACAEIGHICYHGGEAIQLYLATDNRLLQTMFSLISNRSEIFSLRLQVMQTLQVLIDVARPNILEEVIVKNKAEKTLADILDDENEELRLWAAHTLWSLQVKCLPTNLAHLKTAAFQRRLRTVASDDWKNWTYNDAEELMKLLEMKYSPEDVSLCVKSAQIGRAHV